MERPGALMEAPWPHGDPELEDGDAEAQMGNLQELITHVRRLRKEYGVPEGTDMRVVLAAVPASFQSTLVSEKSAVQRLARVNEVVVGDAHPGGAGAHTVLDNGTELFLPLEGVIDLHRERERLMEEISRLSGQMTGAKKKLENRDFLEKAPDEVVAREREKADNFQRQLQKLSEKLRVIEGG
jgi:valyl-tRNA synthetase